MLTRVAIGLMAGTLLAAPALAQTQTQTSPARPQGQNPAVTAPTANQGAAAQGQAGNVQYITQNRSDLWRASQLEGLNVYNQNNEKIGDIREVLVNRQGDVEAVVIGVGGFLGIGERDVAVPYNALQWVNEERTAANTGNTGMTGTTSGTTGNMAGTTGSTAGMTGTTAGTNTANAPATATGTMAQPTTTGAVGTDNRMAATAGDRMRDYPERAILPNASKEQLENAPQFRYAQ